MKNFKSFSSRFICSKKQLDGSCNVTSDSQLYTICSKTSFFVSANTYEKYNENKKYCIAHHDEKMCFQPFSRYHSVVIGDNKELLQKMDAICFNYQHVDCLYTLFNYRFSGKVVVKSGQFFDNVQRAVHFNHQVRGTDRMPSIAKKKTLEEEAKQNLLSAFQKTESTQTSGSVIAHRIAF